MTSVGRTVETVVVAPDSFKGTFSAAEVAEAIGRGLEIEGYAVDLCPVADGGEGTMAALAPALGAAEQFAQAADPLGMEIEAAFAMTGDVAIVETAVGKWSEPRGGVRARRVRGQH